jgi:vancomycin permeability regulator SanA
MLSKILKFLIVLIIVDIAIVIIRFDSYKSFWNSNHCYDLYDAAVIFFADYDDELEQIGELQKKRLDYAFKLYSEKRFKNFILVGGNRIDGSIKGSELSSKYLISKKIPKDIIYFDSYSYDTKTNWREAEKIISKNKFNRIICISSPLHIYRIAKIIDREYYCYDSYELELNNPLDYIILWYNINKELFVFTLYEILPEDYYLELLKDYRDKKFSDKNEDK